MYVSLAQQLIGESISWSALFFLSLEEFPNFCVQFQRYEHQQQWSYSNYPYSKQGHHYYPVLLVFHIRVYHQGQKIVYNTLMKNTYHSFHFLLPSLNVLDSQGIRLLLRFHWIRQKNLNPNIRRCLRLFVTVS